MRNPENIIEVINATVRFNKATENHNGLKEYVIKMLKGELMFQEFLALRDVNFEVKRGESWAFDEIVEFSELYDFIDVPVKNFSSGMAARLGFSIATIVKPDILIVDEALSVGDAQFQAKSQRKMEKMINEGATLLFVSHSINQVKELCHNALWIDKGIIKASGKTRDVIPLYEKK